MSYFQLYFVGEVNPPPTASDNEESDEAENVSNLCQEAALPLQVLK